MKRLFDASCATRACPASTEGCSPKIGTTAVINRIDSVAAPISASVVHESPGSAYAANPSCSARCASATVRATPGAPPVSPIRIAHLRSDPPSSPATVHAAPAASGGATSAISVHTGSAKIDGNHDQWSASRGHVSLMLPPGTRTVLFDFDRTLGRAKSHFGMYVDAAAEHGVEVSEAALAAAELDDAWAKWMTPEGPAHPDASKSEAAFAEVRREIAALRLRGAGVDCDQPTLDRITARIAALEGESDNYMLYDDTVPALEALARRGVQSLIVSNHVWRLPEIIRGLGVSARFEGVITSARVGARKPHPAIFRAALRLAGTTPAETVYVGDSYKHDVEGARGVDMASILIDRDARYTTAEVDVPVISLLTELAP